MSDFFIIAIVVLIFLVVFQIAKASEYVSILKGEENARKQNNRVNGFFMIAFLVVGLIGVWYCNKLYYHKTLLSIGSASEQGQNIDTMLWITLGVTATVFFITQILLFWFAFRYQERDDQKVYYFAHSNKLEIIWTSIPAVVLTVLIVFGLKYWFKFTSAAPKGAQLIEITGHQFGWEIRYPGRDGVLGRKNFKLTDASKGNPLGVDWSDPASHDDIHVPTTMHVVVNRPVNLVINSQDVIHDVGLPHFGMKMDAVPGIPTTIWFTPIYTTAQMKAKTGNPDFTYEIACDQLCGRGHYTMRGIVIVETQEEFDAYMASQKPEYYKAFPDLDPDKPAVKDSTTKTVAQNLNK